MDGNGNGDDPVAFTVEDLSIVPIVKEMQMACPTAADGYVRIHPWGHIFPSGMEHCVQEISDFHCYDDDVWIASFPKCGTTWTIEMVWCITNGLDIQTAKNVPLHVRVPFLEFSKLSPISTGFDSIDMTRNASRPRLVKTHLPFGMLPKQCEGKKLIYVTRNPRDACVSFFHHYQNNFGYTGRFKHFAQLFLNGLCDYSPFMSHVLEYWKRRHLPNVLFVTYEEMKCDLPQVIKKVAEFLGKEITSEDVAVLSDHLSFDSMKGNSACNNQQLLDTLQGILKEKGEITFPEGGRFMRKGEIGNWKEYFDEELLEEFEAWEVDELKDEELQFVFE